MRKKLIYLLSLALNIIFLFFIILLNFTYSPFESSNVVNTIELLSSDTYNGRLAGSIENTMVASYLEKQFIDNNVKPYKDSYIDNFTTICPIPTNTNPYLKILSNGEVVEEFKYGVDFKEDLINFKNNTFSFSNSDKVSSFMSAIEVVTSTNKFLFFVPKDEDFSFRSSFMSDFPFDAIIMITENTKNKILSSLKDGKEITIHLPFESKSKTISNVVGVIEGTDKTQPPLILTAHFDHLGKDGIGNKYGGALDNASGTGFILELQRSLSTLSKPNRDIIFVALNAEEFGLLGSKYFAEKNIFNIKDAEIINFDMVGASNFPITFMQGVNFKDKDSELLESLKSICDKNNTPYIVEYQDSSDHASFNKFGFDSLTISHSDLSKIHTPNDTIEFIDSKAIETVFDVMQKKIIDTCYSPLTMFLYNKLLILLLTITLLFLICLPIFNKNKKSR